MNNLYYYKPIIATNPCAELCSSEDSSCILGSLVLSRFVEDGKINWDKLDYTIRVAVRFLDNVISVSTYPLQKIEEESKNTRRIGLGVTAFHDMLLKLGIKYNSEESLKIVDRIFPFICNKAYETSSFIAVEKGVFSVFDKEKIMKSGFIKTLKNSVRLRIREYGLRNSNLLSCAPTGTISIISGNCSSGIEPIFGPGYKRRYYDKKSKDTMREEIVFHPLFDQYMTEGKDVSFFESADDIPLKAHLDIQKTCQKYIDQSISKTVLVNKDKISKKEIDKLIKEYLPELKGLTIYVGGSRENQPITALDLKTAKKLWAEEKEKHNTDGEQSKGTCKDGTCEL
jgi:ribonucleoside-diphosphate reductase alpha chain